MMTAPIIRFQFWKKNHSSLGNGGYGAFLRWGPKRKSSLGGMLRPMWDTEGLRSMSQMPLGPWESGTQTGGCQDTPSRGLREQTWPPP